jgi:KipI family sensor histidine kinase inhibitor
MKNLIFEALSENSLLISWPDKICPIQHQQIIDYQQLVNQHYANFMVESIVSYNSLMLYYRFEKISFENFSTLIKKLISSHQLAVETMAIGQLSTLDTKNLAVPPDKQTPRQVTIPVYYGEEAGWDLNQIAQQCQLSVSELITLHSTQRYRAYALGFTPGFCYLATLPTVLQQPRKNTPRAKVPAGAVAIAGQQSAIYPSDSPGGWHIIGQTPLPMFQFTANDSKNSEFISSIQVGDEVTFVPIDLATFQSLGGQLSLEPVHLKALLKQPVSTTAITNSVVDTVTGSVTNPVIMK